MDMTSRHNLKVKIQIYISTTVSTKVELVPRCQCAGNESRLHLTLNLYVSTVSFSSALSLKCCDSTCGIFVFSLDGPDRVSSSSLTQAVTSRNNLACMADEPVVTELCRE